jgi:drug/metabolite transporter (DMT)-like permease
MSTSIATGVFLGTLGSVCINAGQNLQSLGMSQLAERDEEMISATTAPSTQELRGVAFNSSPATGAEPLGSCQSITWVVGTAVFASGSLLNFAAFAFAPQSMLASLEGVQFVSNVILGKLLLGKVVTPMMYAGTAVVVAGVLLTVLSASKVHATNILFTSNLTSS